MRPSSSVVSRLSRVPWMAFSTQTYSPPKPGTGLKSIFMCRLALGAHTPMAPNQWRQAEPPVRDKERLLNVGELKYDSTTDGHMQNVRLPRDGGTMSMPQVMVAWKDNQAIPEYLVRFRMR